MNAGAWYHEFLELLIRGEGIVPVTARILSRDD